MEVARNCSDTARVRAQFTRRPTVKKTGRCRYCAPCASCDVRLQPCTSERAATPPRGVVVAWSFVSGLGLVRTCSCTGVQAVMHARTVRVG